MVKQEANATREAGASHSQWAQAPLLYPKRPKSPRNRRNLGSPSPGRREQRVLDAREIGALIAPRARTVARGFSSEASSAHASA